MSQSTEIVRSLSSSRDIEVRERTSMILKKLKINKTLDELYDDYLLTGDREPKDRKYKRHFTTIRKYCRTTYHIDSSNPWSLGRYEVIETPL